MKRTIKLYASTSRGTHVEVRLQATMDTAGITEGEVAKCKAELTSRLMNAVAGLPYSDLTIADVEIERPKRRRRR